MSEWRFHIIDRNDIATEIEEPVGFDAVQAILSRDKEYHGIFFDDQGDTFEFYDEAHDLLKDEYDLYGSQGIMTLLIEEDCGAGFTEYSRGRFDFNKYEHFCGISCYVKLPVEGIGEVMDLRNRINQKVNLETLKSFDETIDLPAYDSLPFTLGLPSKAIVIQNIANRKSDISGEFLGPTDLCSYSTVGSFGQIETPFDDVSVSELGGFYFPTDIILTDIFYSNSCYSIPFPEEDYLPTPWAFPVVPTGANPVLNYAEEFAGFGQISDKVLTEFRLKGAINIENCSAGRIEPVFFRIGADSTVEWLWNVTINEPLPQVPSPHTFNFDETFSQELTIIPGDRFYFFIFIAYEKSDVQATSGLNAFSVEFETGNYFRMKTLSKTPATNSKVFAINETISRIAEAITNDKLRGYSEYFGRTDSQPYALDSDGNGSLEAVTNGLRIRRQENKIPGKTSLFTLSLQDVFEGLNPIHNIGMGVEPDTNRTGYNRLRVEPWDYFYNNDIIFTADNIDKITRKADARNIFSTYQFGYQKWEAEEYNGLDEFLTKRIYRTTLSNIKNDLVKLSKMVTSGYALEITRRKGNSDSKDWRYDKETFLICCTRTAKFHCIFSEATSEIVFDYSGSITPFTSLTEITISGSSNNDGTYTIFRILFDSNGTVSIKITGATLTDEESYSVIFTGVVLPTTMYVELGNITTPENIIDPNSIYNWRIRPVSNAMRWMNKVLASYKQFDTNAKIIFTDGDANYFAKGEMTATNGKLENGPIAENDPISLSVFNDIMKAKPLMAAETVQFEYDISSSDYLLIKQNPYGLVDFSSDCDEGQGWIETLNYKPEQGKATFILIPKAL
jgi:hypothetical protein